MQCENQVFCYMTPCRMVTIDVSEGIAASMFKFVQSKKPLTGLAVLRVRLKPNGTRWRTRGGVKAKLANRVGSQYSHTTSERGVSSITNVDAHASAASSRLNWSPRRFKWTRPFPRKTKSDFCACAITFQTHYTWVWVLNSIVSLLSFQKCKIICFWNHRAVTFPFKILNYSADFHET